MATSAFDLFSMMPMRAPVSGGGRTFADFFQGMAPGTAGSTPSPWGALLSDMGGTLRKTASGMADDLRDPFGSLAAWNKDNPGVLAAMGSGLMTGDVAGGFAEAGKYRARALDKAEQREQQNTTRDWLMRKYGMSMEDATAATMNPAILNSYMAKANEDYTSDQRNFLYAQENPEFAQFLGMGREQDQFRTIMDPAERAAYGIPADDQRPYQVDGKGKLYPIGGGGVTVNNQLPAEMGARIGLGDNFLRDYEGIRTDISDGELDGVLARGQLAAGMGKPAEVWRAIETGKEALVRNLTGAGMSVSEAENQASRYQIGATDSQATMLDKLARLKADLEATRAGAIGARTGQISAEPPGAPGAADPLGIR